MKHIVVVAALAVLSSATVFSQTQSAKPAAAPSGTMKEGAKPAPQKDISLAQGPGQSQVTEDARHCLEQSTNTDIIKCAEPYLPAKYLRVKR